MNLCLFYKYALIHIVIGYVKCADKPGKLQPSGAGESDDSDDDNYNYNLIVKGIEKILEEEDTYPEGDYNPNKQGGKDDYKDKNIDYKQGYQSPPQPEQGKPVSGESPRYYLISSEKDQNGQNKFVPITYLEYIPFPQFNQQQTQTMVGAFNQNYTPYQVNVTNESHSVKAGDIEGDGCTDLYDTNDEQKQTHDPITETSIVEPGKPDKTNLLESNQPESSKKSDHSYKHNRPTKPKPSKPTQPSMPTEPSMPSEPSKPPSESTKELKPEHVVVEMGSDDESEKEEGAVGGAGGGDDEDKEGPIETVKICEKIKFFKLNHEVKLVPMTNKDYKKKYENEHETMYEFEANLAQVKFGDDVVYSHIFGKHYPITLTYKKLDNVFVIYRKDSFLYMEKNKDKWTTNSVRVIDYIKFYKEDGYGNDILITTDEYYVNLTSKKSLKYSFKFDIFCTKIMVKNMLVWKKTSQYDYPSSVSYTRSKRVIIYFKGNFIEFAQLGDNFVCFYKKLDKKT